ncbi:hypothetical protein SALGADO_89 [Arthrobacter phage Salgado]|uniref:Uncharacterized protein n=1 Tax=Arthrobacter phage Salgado TaxID=1772314 RepID=A0A0U4IP34_9CAUD|nr:hypothetical protein KMD22_gp89 [Arthrobacter phage Salgado]ALY10255.1 hypothetical protein SALGADO_89 [Arthrobacter phage Salgado]
MIRDEIVLLLAYIQVFDKRTVGNADVDGWLDVLPASLDLETAKAAAREFFSHPADPRERHFINTRDLLFYVRKVRRDREIAEAKERAERPAITMGRSKPPAGGWRSLMPEGKPRMTEKHEVYTQSIPVVPNYGAALKAP